MQSTDIGAVQPGFKGEEPLDLSNVYQDEY